MELTVCKLRQADCHQITPPETARSSRAPRRDGRWSQLGTSVGSLDMSSQRCRDAKEKRQTGDGSRKRLETKQHGFLILATLTKQVQTTNQAFKMTTYKNINLPRIFQAQTANWQTRQTKHICSTLLTAKFNSSYYRSSRLQLQTCQTLKTSKHINMLNKQIKLKQLLPLGPTHLSNMSDTQKLSQSLLCAQTASNFQVLLVSWPRSNLHRGRIPVLERKRLRASVSSP